MPSSNTIAAISVAIGLSFTHPSVASEASPTTYDNSFFAEFAVQTALEMIDRIPGFTLVEGSDDRGLSQGGTNVLLNGEVIVGKAGSVTDQIAQVSATNVKRIEILDAASLSIPGYTGLVANIVTQKTSFSGSFSWNPEWYPTTDTAWANGDINLSGSWNDVDFTTRFSSTMVRIGFFGPENLTEADGTIFETRDESLLISGEQPSLSGTIKWRPASGQRLNAKAYIDRLNINRPQDSLAQAVTARGVDGQVTNRTGVDERNARVDFDYSFPSLGGELKLISFVSNKTKETNSQSVSDDLLGIRVSESRFEEQAKSHETVVRAEQSWADSDNRSWQVGGEIARNALDLETLFTSVDPINRPLEPFRSASVAKIEEERGEITLAHGRPLGSKVDVQLSVGAEYSTLSQGDIARDFLRPKGFLSVNLKPAVGWTVTGRVAREVGQINFRDFVATVSLVDDVSTQDNPELVPEQSWRFSARTERRFSAGHVASLEFGHDIITDLVDRIPLGENGDAIGNIPDATRSRLAGTLSINGDTLGLDGAQLDIRGTWQWSSVIDPIEGFERDIRALRTEDIKLDFRHDIPNTDWSYGVSVQTLELAPEYRSNLVQFSTIPGGGLTPGINSIFVEKKNFRNFRIRATLSEFLEQENNFRRVIYSGRRDISDIDRIESRARDLDGPYFKLSVGKTFG